MAVTLASWLLASCSWTGPSSAGPSNGSGVSAAPALTTSPSTSTQEWVVLAAGDVAGCDSNGDEATAALLDAHQGMVLALGDLAYPDGTADAFARCYDPSWGRHRDRTWPTPGNHEYESADAAPYFAYFGPRVGEPGQPWYAVQGAWTFISLNSNCDRVGGCGPGSPQAQWLRDSLPALSPGPGACTLAFWHHPRWSSGSEHGSDPRTDTLWRLLHDAGVDVVLTGHDHEYERFVPMDADGAADPDGMVEFVVGTGGRSLYEFGPVLATSAARDNSTIGLLQLTLRPGGYAWAFVPASPTGFSDAGSAGCR